jgi:hypothetical protein
MPPPRLSLRSGWATFFSGKSTVIVFCPEEFTQQLLPYELAAAPLTLGVTRSTEIMQRFCCMQHLFFARLSATTLPVQT